MNKPAPRKIGVCSHCGKPVVAGQAYRVTKRGKHHADCADLPLDRAQLETRNVWQVFNKLSDAELNALLTGAGVIVPERRFVKLEAVMLVWFGGKIPDKDEFNRLNKVYRELAEPFL